MWDKGLGVLIGSTWHLAVYSLFPLLEDIFFYVKKICKYVNVELLKLVFKCAQCTQC